MTVDDIARLFSLDAEQCDKLKIYADCLVKWQRKINLVGPSTIEHLWQRHFLDSAQLWSLIPKDDKGALLDMGSGAGFPGAVLAVLGRKEVHLVESDQRKAAFLQEIAFRTQSPMHIHCCRLEVLPSRMPLFKARVITARALAQVTQLLAWGYPFCTSETEWLLLKGRKVDEELTEARKVWHMHTDKVSSQSDPEGVVLHLRGVSRE